MGGVIFRQDTDEAIRRFRSIGLDTDKYMGVYGQKDFFLDIELGRITKEEFCQQMAAATGRAEISCDEASRCWLGFVRGVPVERLHYLQTLRRRYHLCLLSNTNPFIMDFMQSKAFSADGKPISCYFDTLFCSYEMGLYKPHADIFLKALETDGMVAGETLFVDDSKKNCDGAAAVGMQTLHVQTNEDWMPRLQQLLNAQ